MTIEQVAEHLDAAVSTVSRLETGARALSAAYQERLVELYGLEGADADLVRALARSGRRRASLGAPPPTRETDYVKIEQTDFVELERDAEHIREFNSGHIPGLLQTVKYMWASMTGTAPDVTPTAVNQAMSVRAKRQHKFISDFRYEVIVDEAALARRVGSDDVMAEQAQRIIDLINANRVEFHVIAFGVGAHPGANSQFVAMGLGQAETPDVVFSEGLFGHAKYNSRAEVARFDRIWSRLKSLVEPRAATLNRLQALADAPTAAPETSGRGPEVGGPR